MPSNTTEAALEACIEKYLTGAVSRLGGSSGAQQEPPAEYGGKGIGYVRGNAGHFNPEFALDETKFWAFLEAAQSTELEKLHYKPDWKEQLVTRLHQKLGKYAFLSFFDKMGPAVGNLHSGLLYRNPA